MTFQEKVIAKIKEYFPDAEYADTHEAYGIAVNLEMGIAPTPKEKSAEMDFFHRRIARRCSGPKEDAEFLIMCDISELRFYKTPDAIFVRSVSDEKGHDFSSSETFHHFYVRFTMGYKI